MSWETCRESFLSVCANIEEMLTSARTYSSAEELIRFPGLKAVLIATETTFHAILAIKALEAGLVSCICLAIGDRIADFTLQHVLLEKPISIDVASALPVLEAAKAHPKQKIMVAFSRRCQYQSVSSSFMSILNPLSSRRVLSRSLFSAGHVGDSFLYSIEYLRCLR
jgi:hypothetical protein